MRTLQLYVCEHCGTQYADKAKARECEAGTQSAGENSDAVESLNGGENAETAQDSGQSGEEETPDGEGEPPDAVRVDA